jgi:signal transduction histidine kinase
MLCVPLVFREKSLGVLSVYTGKPHRFSNEEVRLLTAMADLSAVAIARAQLLEKITRVEENLKISERMSALGWLAAEVAHEIRNPLAVMQMIFHSMIENFPLDDSSAKDVELMRKKMQQMNRIVEQVLTFAKSSEPIKENISVEDLFDDLILLVRHKLAEQKIELRENIQENCPKILGDRTQLEQAILNLILNACQAMPNGGALTLAARKAKNKKIQLTIKDTGHGISEKQKKELFQPLITTRREGTGIGLALVHKTIEHHNGKISVTSQKSEGTTFSIMLPSVVKTCEKV